MYCFSFEEERLKNNLWDLGASSPGKSGPVASAWLPYNCSPEKKKKIKRSLESLAACPADVELFCMFFLSTFLACISLFYGTNEILDQIYPKYYYKKYCFIKEKLEQYYSNMMT